ncbi:MAG: extracellular solute-binding protein [Planctomycetes bacterium]|nr:extracellular solute-binding protein [Planctomycetota bacterium]
MRHLAAALLLLACACGRAPDVVLYCALDQSFSEPVVRAFEQRTGLSVQAYYDVEANKSVGLRRRLQQEAARPIADVFWNNEVVQTTVLARGGLLQPYRSPSAEGIPARFRDPSDLWCGFAARGRVLIVNTALRPDPDARPAGLPDFLDTANSGACGMAAPLTGTTATHAAFWIARHGLAATLERFERLRANGVRFASGNAHVMRLVRDGQLAFGWTDTDDCQVALDEGYPVAQVVPDQGEGGEGLLLIPNTVALVTGAPHAEAGRRLIDFLLSEEVEALLAQGPSAQVPLRASVPRPPHVLDVSAVRVADADWAAVGLAYDEGVAALEAAFQR